MKGFIELTKANGEKVLINIHHIFRVTLSTIQANGNTHIYQSSQGDNVIVLETYDEVRRLISEAL